MIWVGLPPNISVLNEAYDCMGVCDISKTSKKKKSPFLYHVTFPFLNCSSVFPLKIHFLVTSLI